MKSINPFNRESVERLSASKAEPSWMTALRLQAWEALKSSDVLRPTSDLGRRTPFTGTIAGWRP